jgi:ABC-2 type transport system ATP-binding protein
VSYIIQTQQLTKRFRSQLAIENVDLAIEQGSIYGLLGPNGAGKSTLLKHLVGLLRPTSGQVLIAGEPWQRKHLWQIGTLIESPSLYEHLTARENLKVHSYLLGLPDRRTDEVLEQVELINVGNKKVAQYSLGMKQRLGIASALLSNPQLLILDEPTNGLDPAGIREMRQLIQRFCEQGMTVLISSHILSEIEHIVTHLGIISKGQLRYQGTLQELMRHGQQRLEIETPHVQQAVAVLQTRYPGVQNNGTKVVLAGANADTALIVTLLTQHGIAITKVDTVQDDLEALFLRIVESGNYR